MDFLPIAGAFLAGGIVATMLVKQFDDADTKRRVWRACEDHAAIHYYTKYDPKNETGWIEKLEQQHAKGHPL